MARPSGVVARVPDDPSSDRSRRALCPKDMIAPQDPAAASRAIPRRGREMDFTGLTSQKAEPVSRGGLGHQRKPPAFGCLRVPKAQGRNQCDK